MAKLTTKQRKMMPKSEFALNQKKDGKTEKRFPINDKEHARKALQLLPKAKDVSASEAAMIRAKARKKLGKKKGDMS